MPDLRIESSPRERLEELLGRRRGLWMVGVVVVGVVAMAMALLGRGATARVAPPAEAPVAPVAAPIASPTAVVYVDVAGAVRAPGLYSLAAGARVADALAAAGGARPRADLSSLNLAQVVADGTKILVPARGDEALPSAAAAPVPVPSATATVVSLNVADQAALETIPGIGPVTAAAILDYRSRIGSFDSIDQLLEIDGIGPATLESIRAYVSL
jgi:competence protein ComEA